MCKKEYFDEYNTSKHLRSFPMIIQKMVCPPYENKIKVVECKKYKDEFYRVQRFYKSIIRL